MTQFFAVIFQALSAGPLRFILIGAKTGARRTG